MTMTHFNNTYRPLPKALTIRESGVHGLGLFAIEDIAEDTNLGLLRIYINDEWIRTPLGGFINHTENPNCSAIDYPEEYGDLETCYLFTTRNIEAGDEILLKYSMSEYDDVDLFELYDLMQGAIDERN